MTDLNYLAILVAAVAVFVTSGAWYVAFGKQLAQLHEAYAEAAARQGPPRWLVPVELSRSLVVTTVVAGLAAQIGIAGWTGAVLLALALWIGFPLVLWIGAILHEKVPVKLAAIHAGDWLVKLIVIAVIVGLWR